LINCGRHSRFSRLQVFSSIDVPGGFRSHDAQAVTTFAFEPVNQTPRFLVSEFGCFTAAIAEHSPPLFLKIAGHCLRSHPGCQIDPKHAETRANPSLAFEIRFSLLEECAHAFVFVFARKAQRE
jgi:hypothetical protein